MLNNIIKGTYGTMYYVTDMDKSIAFFKENLGIEPSFASADWTEFNLNGPSLCLHPTDDKNEESNGSLIIHVENMKQLLDNLKQQGVKDVSGPYEVHPGAYHGRFTDPDGNTISLYEGPKTV